MRPAAMLNCVFVLLSTSYLLLARGQESPVLTIDMDQGGVVTRLGCNKTLFCSGEGMDIYWKTFSSDQPIGNTSSTIVTNEDLGNGMLKTTLTLLNVMDSGFFTCIVERADMSSDTTTVLLKVEDAIAIEPPIENVDLTVYHIGSTLTIGCPVATCAEPVTIEFLGSSGEVLQSNTISQTDPLVVSLALEVMEDTPGMYACRAQGVLGSETFNVEQSFNITGTPLPPATTPPSVVGTTSSDSTGPSGPSGATTSTDGGLPLQTSHVLATLLALAWYLLL